jgi:hypothetical protein
VVIRPQNTTPSRPNARNPYAPNSVKNTTTKKCVTVQILSPQPLSVATQRLKPLIFSGLFLFLARFLSPCPFLFRSVPIGVIGFPYQTFATYYSAQSSPKDVAPWRWKLRPNAIRYTSSATTMTAHTSASVRTYRTAYFNTIKGFQNGPEGEDRGTWNGLAGQ